MAKDKIELDVDEIIKNCPVSPEVYSILAKIRKRALQFPEYPLYRGKHQKFRRFRYALADFIVGGRMSDVDNWYHSLVGTIIKWQSWVRPAI